MTTFHISFPCRDVGEHEYMFLKRCRAEECNTTHCDLQNTEQCVHIRRDSFRKSFGSLNLSSLTDRAVLCVLRVIRLDLMTGKGKILSDAHAWGDSRQSCISNSGSMTGSSWVQIAGNAWTGYLQCSVSHFAWKRVLNTFI